MFKTFTLFIAIIILTNFTLQDDEYICGYNTEVKILTGSSQSGKNPQIKALIDTIYYQMMRKKLGGQPASILIEEASFAGTAFAYAAAGKRKNQNLTDERFISYDPAQITDKIIKANNGWLLKSIMMHELGHHINANMFRKTATYESEQWADDFSGFHLAQLGAPLDAALAGVSTLSSVKGENGYPSRAERITFVTNGWNFGKANESNSLVRAIAFTTVDRSGVFFDKIFSDQNNIMNAVEKGGISTKPDSSLQSQLTISSSVLNHKSFFIDQKYLYFKEGGKSTVVGRVLNSSNSKYKYMIVDRYYKYMYITENNQILIPNAFGFGKNDFIHVGYLSND